MSRVPFLCACRHRPYLPFLCGLVMICTVSFWDDVHSLPDSVRMVVQIVSTLLMFWSVGLYAAFALPEM